jgi:integrase
MPRLTKTFIDTIESPSLKDNGKPAQVFYRDSSLVGFGLYVMSSGTKTYFVETRVNGKVKRIRIGRYGQLTPDQARKQAQILLGDIATGGDPVKDKQALKIKAVTLREAFNDYLSARKTLKPFTVKDYRKAIERDLADWCDKPLKDITKDMVEKRHRKHGESSQARANITMRVLRAVFNFARDKYETSDGESLFPLNPVDRLNRTRAWYRVERRQTLIKESELKAWYEAVMQIPSDTTRDYLLFLLFTGLRKAEGARLAWVDVDLKEKSFQIPDTKNRDLHRLPLSDFLYAMLKQRHTLYAGESSWVFPSDVTETHLVEPRRSIERVRLQSKVNFSLHDLRRTFITTAESLDIPAYALKRLLNHRLNDDVTAGYIVPNVKRLQKPMQQITNYFKKEMKLKI